MDKRDDVDVHEMHEHYPEKVSGHGADRQLHRLTSKTNSASALNQANVQHTVIKGNEAFAAALVSEPPNPWARTQIMLYVFSIVGFFCSTMNGYDGSLINNLLINPAFLEYYHAENAGIWAGIISSMYQIGGVVALPFGKGLCRRGLQTGRMSQD